MHLQRLRIFSRDGCDRGEDELWRIIALNKLHTSAENKMIMKKKKVNLWTHISQQIKVDKDVCMFVYLSCWWDSTRKHK